jgi:hypothetical protein
LAAGVETVFVVPEAKVKNKTRFESDAEKSANTFKKAFPKETEKGMKVITLPWDFGHKFDDSHEDGRPQISFLTRFFRWNYYECPAQASNSTVIKSLLVFRHLVRSDTGNFAFCPASEEIASFQEWLDRVLTHDRNR